MNRGLKAAAIALIIGAVLAVTVPITGAAPRQEAPDEADPILAIVSPFAFPVCSVSGAATLLVPILGPVAQDALGLGDTVSVGDLVLDGLGPVFIVCGSLPAAPGRRCQLDNDLAVLWPEQLTTATPAPAPLGSTTDATEAALAAVGLPPEAALQEALQCDVPPRAVAPEPGAAPQPRPLASEIGSTPSAPSSSDTQLGSRPAATSSVGESSQTSRPTASVDAPAGEASTLLERASRDVPGGVLWPRVLVAILLASFLTGSWLSSWRLTTVATPR